MGKVYWIVILLIGLLIGSSYTIADSAAIPDILGNWTGSSVGHAKALGFFDNVTNMSLIVSEQKGMAFNGTLTYLSAFGVVKKKGFSGVFDSDLKTFYMSEYDSGMDIGTLVSPDEMSLVYIDTGENSQAALDTFVREKTG